MLSFTILPWGDASTILVRLFIMENSSPKIKIKMLPLHLLNAQCFHYFLRFSGLREKLFPSSACPVTIWSMEEGEHPIRPKNSQVNHLAGWRSCQVLWCMLIFVHKAKIQYLLGPYWERLACLNKRQFGTLNMFYTVLLDDMIWYNPKTLPGLLLVVIKIICPKFCSKSSQLTWWRWW